MNKVIYIPLITVSHVMMSYLASHALCCTYPFPCHLWLNGRKMLWLTLIISIHAMLPIQYDVKKIITNHNHAQNHAFLQYLQSIYTVSTEYLQSI